MVILGLGFSDDNDCDKDDNGQMWNERVFVLFWASEWKTLECT